MENGAFNVQELEQMLKDKQIELNNALEENLKLKSEMKSLEIRALKVFKENELFKVAPELAKEKAVLEHKLNIAEQFVKSGAFKVKTKEEAYTVIVAGEEMGMKPIESLQSLYIVNGILKFWGDKMVARITKHGLKIQYLEESNESVKVRVYSPDGEFDETEIALASDPEVKNGKAFKFSPKNKLRFHGIRKIASFHLPHLFGSVFDEFSSDFIENSISGEIATSKKPLMLSEVAEEKERLRLKNHIEESIDLESLIMVRDHVSKHDLSFEYEEKFNELSQKIDNQNEEE